jgi:hypothetical protein
MSLNHILESKGELRTQKRRSQSRIFKRGAKNARAIKQR